MRTPPAPPDGPAAPDGPGADGPDTDAALLRAHVAGDPEAFGTLVRRHQGRLWAVALRTCRDPEEAKDALQDALVSAYRRADSYRGEAAVTTWLHRIVVNAALDRMRRAAVRATVPLAPEADDDGYGLADPRDTLAQHELRWELERALAELPDDQRAALVLVDVEGWSVADAAEVLGVPVGTVKSRCSRGRARLAERLAHLRPGAADVPPTPAVPLTAVPLTAAPRTPVGNPAGPARVAPTVGHPGTTTTTSGEEPAP